MVRVSDRDNGEAGYDGNLTGVRKKYTRCLKSIPHKNAHIFKLRDSASQAVRCSSFKLQLTAAFPFIIMVMLEKLRDSGRQASEEITIHDIAPKLQQQ